MKQISSLRLTIATMAVIGSFCATEAMAQVPGRFYLKSLDGASGLPVIVNSISGNTNPFDMLHAVIPGTSPSASSKIDATMAWLATLIPFRCSIVRPWQL